MIRIVATGDSMTDTAGEGCPALAGELKKIWPDKEFEIINHGVGGTRVGYGLWRLTHPFEHKDRKHPPLVSLDPDIVLLESFAYNNASDGPRGKGLEHFKEMHTAMVNTIRKQTQAQIVFVITIAPDTGHFLETVPNFYNTPLSIRKWMAEDRNFYLKEALKIASEMNLPVANVFQATLDAKDQGIPLSTFINPEDWIHPGKKGHELIAKTIVDTLKNENLI